MKRGRKTNEEVAIAKDLAQALTKNELNDHRIQLVEDEILAQALKVIASVGYFSKIDPNNPDKVPEDWKELPPEELSERMRIAHYACANASEVPFGMKAAFQILEGIMRSRGRRAGGERVLNVQSITLPAPVANYPVIDADSDD